MVSDSVSRRTLGTLPTSLPIMFYLVPMGSVDCSFTVRGILVSTAVSGGVWTWPIVVFFIPLLYRGPCCHSIVHDRVEAPSTLCQVGQSHLVQLPWYMHSSISLRRASKERRVDLCMHSFHLFHRYLIIQNRKMATRYCTSPLICIITCIPGKSPVKVKNYIAICLQGAFKERMVDIHEEYVYYTSSSTIGTRSQTRNMMGNFDEAVRRTSILPDGYVVEPRKPTLTGCRKECLVLQ